MKERIGLVDIGSNTIRLIVVDIDDHFILHEIQNIKIPARLYHHLDENNIMDQAGIDLLCQILDNFAHEVQILKADKLLPKATAAIRQSQNYQEILDTVKERTGITIDIISGDQEAYYGYNAIIHTMSDRDALTVDIGGGSTEITYFKGKEIQASHSFPFGAVSLTEKFFSAKDHDDKSAIKKARKFVRKQFSDFDFIKDAKLPIIAVGGSARNVTRVHQLQNDYPLAGLHNYQMTEEDLEETLDLFLSLSAKDLQKLDGLSSDRADIITPACLVFQELMSCVQAPCFKFSQYGLREGILYEYIENHYPAAYDIFHIQRQTIEGLTSTYHFSMADHAQRVDIARQVYTCLEQKDFINWNEQEKRLMIYGAYLYFCGRFIERGSASQHSFYLLSNSNMNGFDHKERVAISLIASYKNKSLFKQYAEEFEDVFTEEELDRIQAMGGLIKFSESLNDSHFNIISSIDMIIQNDTLILRIFYNGTLISEVYRGEDQKKHIERIIDRDIQLDFIPTTSHNL